MNEVYNLLSLGQGVNNYAYLVAGGIIKIILDECVNILRWINRSLGLKGAEGFLIIANLNINYLKAIPTPRNYLATATLRDVKGCKRYFKASILVRDREGTVLAIVEPL